MEPKFSATFIHQVFSQITPYYDRMNTILSGGMHRRWKKILVEQCKITSSEVVLDMSTGTGDIVGALDDAYAPCGTLMACDPNADMLRHAQARYPDKAITWIQGCGEDIPLPDQSVDVYVVSFGLRNMSHLKRALGEMRRVLKPQGRALILEFSLPQSPGLTALYHHYLSCLPHIGQWVAGDKESYAYLAESIRAFPAAAMLQDLLRDQGFRVQPTTFFLGGIVALYQVFCAGEKAKNS